MSDRTGVDGEGRGATPQDEIALIIVETCIGLTRPPGRTASSLLDEGEMEQPKIVRDIRMAAARILEHVQAPDQISNLKAENERLRAVLDAQKRVARAAISERDRLRSDLRIAENERDDARKGEEIWALRCGVVLGRSPIPDAAADLGRLPAETFWRAARVDHVVRWEDRTFEERQRWAYAEGACIEKARGQLPEVAKLIAERDVLLGERNSAQREARHLREGRNEARAALAENERKRVEAVEALKPFALAAEHYEPDEGDGNHSLWADDGLRVRHLRAAHKALATPTQETPHVES